MKKPKHYDYYQAKPKKTYFYRDVKIIRLCKVCKVMFKPVRGRYHHNLCIEHRRKFLHDYYAKKRANMSPEEKRELNHRNAPNRKRWIEKNLNRRRDIALLSCWKNKYKGVIIDYSENSASSSGVHSSSASSS